MSSTQQAAVHPAFAGILSAISGDAVRAAQTHAIPFAVSVVPETGEPFAFEGIYRSSVDATIDAMTRAGTAHCKVKVRALIQSTRLEGWEAWPHELHVRATQEARDGWAERAAAERA